VTFISPDIVDDETAVAEGILAGLADRITDFVPSDAHLESPISEATAVAIATAVVVLKDTVLDAYLGFGQRILGIPRIAAGVATAVSTWTVDATQLDPPVIAAGTEVQATGPDGNTVFLVVAEDVPVVAGPIPASTTVTGVLLAAVEAGPDSNGATNPATSEVLVGVLAVSIDAPAANGADAEDPDDYATRAADRAQRMHTIPITPADHAAFATDVAAVARAAAVNRMDPSQPGVDAPGHLTLYLQAAPGDPLDSTAKDTVTDYFAAIERPLNVLLHLADPVEVPVTIAAAVRAAPGVDPDDLEARVAAALSDRVDRAKWDADASAPGGWARVRSTELSVFDLSAAIDDLEGLVQILSITINGGVDSVALPGPVSIPSLTAAPAVTVT
jgi:hypothetical protein